MELRKKFCNWGVWGMGGVVLRGLEGVVATKFVGFGVKNQQSLGMVDHLDTVLRVAGTLLLIKGRRTRVGLGPIRGHPTKKEICVR